jgi:energy-coupling factor transporter transmembrane protein EcfT
MTYRYIFLFIRLFEEMHISLKARSLKQIDIKRARHWIASRISFLFKRSVRMSEEVYLAMLARGYSGEIKKYGK